MVFHFLGNHRVDGAELPWFILGALALMVMIVVTVRSFFGKKLGVFWAALVVLSIVSIGGLSTSGRHYDVHFALTELKSQGLSVVRSDVLVEKTVTFDNAGCELGDFTLFHEDHTVHAYMWQRDHWLWVTPEMLTAMCEAVGGG